MSLLSLETHFFINNIKKPEPKDIQFLINSFANHELMPQYFEERNVTGTSSKQMMFLNPIQGLSIRFLNDRVVIANELNPFHSSEKVSISQKLSDFQVFANDCIRAYELYYGSNLLALRVSLVINVVISDIHIDSKEKFASALHASLPWKSKNYNEVKIRTSERMLNKINNEEINFITSIDDGVIEQNQNGQITTKKDCFLALFDIGTDHLISTSRIDIEAFNALIEYFSELALKRESELVSFFEGS